MTPRSSRAFIYLKISEDRSGAGLGVARQRRECVRLADDRGLEVVEVFTDNDVSAFSRKRRPAYREMLSRLSEVGHVIAWHTDRLHRQTSELEEYASEAKRLQILTFTVKGGAIDLSTSEGILRAEIHASIAKYESAHKAERIKAKSEETIRAGRHAGGARPFGYDLVPRTEEEVAQKLGARYAINESEAALVRQAAEDVISGRAMHSIVRDWNDPNRPGGPVLTTLGNSWKQQTLRQLPLKPRYAGVTTYHGEEVAEGLIPAILPRHMWLDVKRKLESNAAALPPTHTNKARYRVSGIAHCECGELVKTGNVRGRTVDPETGERVPYVIYRCRATGPGHVNKLVSYVDELVGAVAMDLFYALKVSPPSELTAEDQARIHSLEAEHAALTEQVSTLAGEVAAGRIGVRLAGEIESASSVRLGEIDTELADLSQTEQDEPLTMQQDLEHASAHMSDFMRLHIDEQRDFIRQTMRVTLLRHRHGSARFFDPHTVRIEPLVPVPDRHRAGPNGEYISPYFDELVNPGDLVARIDMYETAFRAPYQRQR